MPDLITSYRVWTWHSIIIYPKGVKYQQYANIYTLKETVRLDKVNQALAMFGMEAVPEKKEA